MVKQVSVFLPNEPGVLAKFTELLENNKINIRALTVAETADYGILRIIVNNPDKCIEVLRNANYLVSETDVLAFEVEDKPGGLNKILQTVNKFNINVEYMYVFVQKKKDSAVVIFRFDDNGRAVRALLREGVSILKEEEIQRVQ